MCIRSIQLKKKLVKFDSVWNNILAIGISSMDASYGVHTLHFLIYMLLRPQLVDQVKLKSAQILVVLKKYTRSKNTYFFYLYEVNSNLK